MVNIDYASLFMMTGVTVAVFAALVILGARKFRHARPRFWLVVGFLTMSSLYGTLRLEWPFYDLLVPVLAFVGWPLTLPFLFFEAVMARLWVALVLAVLIAWLFLRMTGARYPAWRNWGLAAVFAVLVFELPYAAQAGWSDRRMSQTADALGLTDRVLLPFSASVQNYYWGRTNWFDHLHGRGCREGRLYLWSYRRGGWVAYDWEADWAGRDLDAWCR